MIVSSERVIMQDAATSVGNGAPISTVDRAIIGMQIVGAFVATITFEGTVNGANWSPIRATSLSDGSVGTMATGPGIFTCACTELDLVRARISAYASGAITIQGVSFADVNIQVSEANIAGHLSMMKFGHNAAVEDEECVIADHGGVQVYLDAAEILKVISNDAADDSAGAGARTVQIHGLDANWDEQDEIVSLVGEASVVTDNTYLRVNRAIVRSAGTGGKNAAAIDIKNNAETNTLLRISIGNNQTLAAFWSVPAGYTAYMVVFYTSVGIAKRTHTKLYVRPLGEVFQLKHHITLLDGPAAHEWPIPMKIAEKSDIEVRGLAAGGGGAVSAGFDLWYEL